VIVVLAQLMHSMHLVPWTPSLDGSMDLRYFDSPPLAFLQTSPGDEISYSSFGDALSPSPRPRPPSTPLLPSRFLANPASLPAQDTSDYLAGDDSHIVDHPHAPDVRVNAIHTSEQGPRESALRAGVRLVSPPDDDEEENPFIQRTKMPVSPMPAFVFDEDELYRSTPCKERARPSLRASAMINSSQAPRFEPPILRTKRSVKFASGLSRLPMASTPRVMRFRPSPSPRHKRSVLTPIMDVTSTVRRNLSSRLPRKPSHAMKTPAKARDLPLLPTLPPGLERIGQGISHTPRKNTRRNAMHIPMLGSTPASSGLLGRLRSMRWKTGLETRASPNIWDLSSERSLDLSDHGLFGARL
jgi:hypothetical protein